MGCRATFTNLFFIHGLVLLCFSIFNVLAQPASLSFSDCTSGDALAPALKINVSTVYGQIVTDSNLGRHLNLTVIGNTGQQIIPISNETGLLSTLFTTSSILSFSIWDNSTFFCSSLVPPSPLPTPDPSNFFCPLAVGPLAFSTAIPFHGHSYELFTIDTRLRVVDTSQPAIELVCVDIQATPLDTKPEGLSLYGPTSIIFWFTVSLAIAYWIVVGSARIVAAWDRGVSGSERSLWSRLESAGYILASAISGEKFAAYPALLRFSTPSMRDVVFHSQFCTILAMVSVQWPIFAYPLFAQTAWSTLTYNITITQGSRDSHWYPLTVPIYDPPPSFADQLDDPSSPIFIAPNVSNTLFMFPPNATDGMESFAAAVGLRPQDLFGICLVLFLGIVAGAVFISLIIWGIDRLGQSISGRGERRSPYSSRGQTYTSATSKDDKDNSNDDGTSAGGHGLVLFRSASIPMSNVMGRTWRFARIKPNSFHGALLYGNLVRILILFHLPVTIFSCYQFSHAHSQSSLVSVILASLTFVVFSLVIPTLLVLRLSTTATNKLYDETRTLMMLGPLYNHYGHGSQLFACLFFATNVIYGVTIGCGQKSGTAQAVIILVTEVGTSLGTSIWLPWGKGATMGLISFFFCVARIMVAVLLVILTPSVSIGDAAGGWVAAAIFFILGLLYVGFALMLATKAMEGIVRLIASIPFERTKHSLDTGLLGVLGLLSCCRPKRKRGRRPPSALPDYRGGSSQQFVLGKNNPPYDASSRGPPSVLRPELAFKPYKEDSDDENGYIMGPWQPFSGPGYVGSEDPPQPVAETVPQSGFARVGGGRAHYENPYAIQQPSTSSVGAGPSFERMQESSIPRKPQPQQTSRESDTPKNQSTVSVNRQVSSGLPPGAMSPAQPAAHVRTKSQTAIIEDAATYFKLLNNQESAPSTSHQQQQSLVSEQRDELRPPPTQTNTGTFSIGVADDNANEEDADSDTAEPRRSHWYNFRKYRRMSEGNYPAQNSGGESGASRSFVVLRDKRPSAPQGSDANLQGSGLLGPPVDDADGRRSFVVIRGKDDAEEDIAKPFLPRQNSSRRLSHA